MRGRLVVDAHRTIGTHLRRDRIRNRRPRRKVHIRRVRTRRPTRIHRHEPPTHTPRRRHIQRHRRRIPRHTTTIGNRQHRRRTSTRDGPTACVEQPHGIERTVARRRRVIAVDIDEQMRGRLVVDAHRTIGTHLRRDRIRNRRPRRKVHIRRVRTRRPTRIHRHEPPTHTPRRRHIQRHRRRIPRHTTTIGNRQHRRHTSTADAEFGELPVDRCGSLDVDGNERTCECESESGETEPSDAR